MDACTQKYQFDERELDWLVQKFGLQWPQRFDVIQGEPPFLLLIQEDRRRLWSQGTLAVALCTRLLQDFKLLGVILCNRPLSGSLLICSFICMIISLSYLVNICKIQKNYYFQTRSERLIIIRIKDYINRSPLWKWSISRLKTEELGSLLYVFYFSFGSYQSSRESCS